MDSSHDSPGAQSRRLDLHLVAQRAWFDAFGGGLQGYLVELFKGKFVDRNGTKVSFGLKDIITDLTNLDLNMDFSSARGRDHIDPG